MNAKRSLLAVLMMRVLYGCAYLQNASTPITPAIVAAPSESPSLQNLAAREVRRYVYLRTGELLPIVDKRPVAGDAVVIGVDAGLGREQYRLKTVGEPGGKTLSITGGSDLAALYGVYAFAEKLGVRFYLHDDVIPDKKIPFALPDLDETREPFFAIRGILPFHDFPEGPDLWEADDYKAVLSQMVKLRMNFIGLHTYTECGWGSEPTTWIGMPEDVDANGNPKFSYPSFYVNTERKTGGQPQRRTGQYGYGGREFFESDVWGPSVMKGLMPHGGTLEEKNEVFIRAGRLLREAFEYARRFGVKTCVGTEIPLTHSTRLLPDEVRARLKEQGKSVQEPEVHKALYRGTFLRAMRTYPLDYYWLWTPEAWRGPQSDRDVQETQDDLLLAVAAAKEVSAPFTLATAGWALGPLKDRTMFDRLLPKEMPFSALNLELGTIPVDEGFSRLKGRPGWAIPWLENDLSMTSPQLWVGRVRRDAYDAWRYGCSGLVGIHWRTEDVGPMVAAMAQAHWLVPEPKADAAEGDRVEVRVQGGNSASFDAAVENTDLDPVYQTVRWDVQGYDFTVPNGSYRVTLQFNEPAYNAVGKRAFGVTLQGKAVAPRLDIFERVGRNRALDLKFDRVEVASGKISIGFLKDISSQLLEADRKAMSQGYADFPCIAGIVIEGPKTIKLNCGGPAWKDYMADPGQSGVPRYLPVDDFYQDWAAHQFGPEAAAEIAAIFARMDGRLPAPAPYCPGGIAPDERPWSAARGDYAFVDELAQLRPRVQGMGNLARFNHWVAYFEYLRAIGKVACTCGEMDRMMKQMVECKEPAQRKAFARETVLPVRVRLNEEWGGMATLNIETANTWGGIGNVMGNETMSRRELNLLERHDAALCEALGGNLPAAAQPWPEYRGAPRIVVPTRRSVVHEGESLKLRVIVLARQNPQAAALHWRPMGQGQFRNIALRHVARGVYTVTLPPAKGLAIEYYIQAVAGTGERLVWPATAPEMNQTVVVAEGMTGWNALKPSKRRR